MRRPQQSPQILGVILLSLVAALALPSFLTAQTTPTTVADHTVLSPERSDAGEWTGTWFYQTHKEKWALWIRETDGVPELKFQFQNYDQGENFISDWQALSRYASKEKKGLFELSFTQRDSNLIRGNWFWQLGTPEVDPSVRIETATFEIYRSGRGRQLVLALNDFERTYEGNRVYRMAAYQAWTFHKASRRHARWQELPF